MRRGLKITIITIIVSVYACAIALISSNSRMYLVEDFMLLVVLSQGIYMIIVIFNY